MLTIMIVVFSETSLFVTIYLYSVNLKVLNTCPKSYYIQFNDLFTLMNTRMIHFNTEEKDQVKKKKKSQKANSFTINSTNVKIHCVVIL